MNRVPVTSSNVAAVGYASVTRTLEVQFNDGSVYQYSDVPPELHEGLMAALRVGRYLDQYIKKADYRYTKL